MPPLIFSVVFLGKTLSLVKQVALKNLPQKLLSTGKERKEKLRQTSVKAFQHEHSTAPTLTDFTRN